jgi:DNA-binding CsgD family transcriptional regulator
MLQVLTYVIFALSVGLSALGILTAVRLRKEFHNEFTSALIYFQIFVYTFGFYGIWGQVFIDKFLAEYLAANIMERIVTYQALVGMPFMILGWYMMLRFAFNLQHRQVGKLATISFLFLYLSGFVVIVYLTFNDINIPLQLYILYYIVFGPVTHLVSGIVLLIRPERKTRIKRKKLQLLAALIIITGIVQAGILYFFDMTGYIALIYIIVFFACYSFIPLVLRYYGILSTYIRTGEEEQGFDEFCTRYEISERERDIIREIYKGLTNKEIAEKLFISLQTVKDHTHRIYIKTGLRNRVELINSIRNL